MNNIIKDLKEFIDSSSKLRTGKRTKIFANT